MYYYLAFIAATASTEHEWLPLVVSIVTAAFTVGGSFFINRNKQKSTDFEAIIDERKEFTKEIREELKRKDAEHQREIEEYEDKYKALKQQLTDKDLEISDLKAEIKVILDKQAK